MSTMEGEGDAAFRKERWDGRKKGGVVGRVRSGLRLYLRVLDRRPVLFYESQYFTRQLDSRGGHR